MFRLADGNNVLPKGLSTLVPENGNKIAYFRIQSCRFRKQVWTGLKSQTRRVLKRNQTESADTKNLSRDVVASITTFST